MTDQQSSSAGGGGIGSNIPKTPFDWLQGGLFFGGGGKSSNNNSNNSGTGSSTCASTKNNANDNNNNNTNETDIIDSINASTDVISLLNGISDNLKEIIFSTSTSATETTSTTTINATTTATKDDGLSLMSPSGPVAGVVGGEGEGKKSNNDGLNLIAARLSRLRFLLYDERRVTSQRYERNFHQQSQNQRILFNPSTPTTPQVAGMTVQVITTTKTAAAAATSTDHRQSSSLHELIPHLLQHMILLPFESRKHVTAIINYMLVCGLDGTDSELYTSVMSTFVQYVQSKFDQIMTIIVHGHDTTTTSSNNNNAPNSTPDIGLHFGSMYRSIIRHPLLYKELVGTSERAACYVYPFLDIYVHVPNFEISSDAMETIRQVFNAVPNNQNNSAGSSSATGSINNNTDEETSRIMAHIAAEFLTRDYEAIWNERYNPKLLSDEANYMTRRIALQILSTVLLTRSNYNIMIQYVASRTNLILVMKLLRDTSPHITLDAFHVFKVFVANPNKPPDVIKILKDNQIKLCKYLHTLHQDKEEMDIQFRDEKALIIATIEAL